MKANIVTRLAILSSLASLFAFDPGHAQERPPNIIVILADDLGNADLGYRGSDIKTPNIDQLAKEGVRLESFHGMPVCTPARAALMTGRYPMRYGLQTLVIFPNHTYGLPTDERTLPQALKEAGYSTAMVGKWHLGHADKKFWPQNRGFDHFYGNLVGEVDYFTKMRGGIVDWQRDGKFFQEKTYYLPLIGDEAVKMIEKQDKNKPFFLYFASLAPHAPYQAQKADEDRYASTIKDPTRRTYAAMITSVDDQVGRIVAALDKRGLRENTLIIFSSDNGGPRSAVVASGAHSREERAASGVKQESLTGEQRRAAWRQGQSARGRRPRADHFQLACQTQATRRQRTASHGGHHAHRAGAGRRQGESRTSRSTARTSGRRSPKVNPRRTTISW